jgi:ketosteroid isomerase-like protein
MSNDTPQHRQQLAQRFLESLGRCDVAPTIEMLDAAATYQVPGLHALAGTFSGPDEMVEHLDSLARRTTGTYEATKWEDWLLGQEYMAAVARIEMQGGGRRYSGRQVFVLRFTRTDQIDHLTVYFEDSAGVARFIGP